MRLLLRAGLAAAAAVTLLAAPASAATGDPVGELGGECDGTVDQGCHVNDDGGPYSCTVWIAPNVCILKWAP